MTTKYVCRAEKLYTLFVSVILGTCLCLVSRGWEQRERSGCCLNEQPCTLYQRKRFSIASKVSSRHFICSAMLFLGEVILNQRNKLLQILCLRGQKTLTGFLLFRLFASFWPAKGQSIYCRQELPFAGVKFGFIDLFEGLLASLLAANIILPLRAKCHFQNLFLIGHYNSTTLELFSVVLNFLNSRKVLQMSKSESFSYSLVYH